ncbi:aldose 1-epimerase [Pseudomonas sp. SWRI102]|uniref:Aldose 1-epimerase n=1 Tax=Pseudomonas marvdashtae TaxID=2745500 RepID=A0A923JPY0_9PSED|nr:aldose 1-epimerase [Pseudomonas marvdashtae]MBV4551640.1 aldose 1-epimerase [Pseudomonas marvdashtae]
MAPHLGASLVEWTLRSTGAPLLRPPAPQALENGLPGKLGCFPLIPWSNRIAQGGFDCPGGWLALEANSPNDPFPIHGSAWQQPWQVIEQSGQEALLQLDSLHPFAYCASLRIRLSGGQLQIAMLVTHTAKQPAWHGLGLHPYFPRTARTGYELECRASGSKYFLLYCPVGLDFFCIEPVSHPVNAHHLPGRPGLRLLEQGQSVALGFSMQCSLL